MLIIYTLASVFFHEKRLSVLPVNYLKCFGHALKEVSGMHVSFWNIYYKTTQIRYVSIINCGAATASDSSAHVDCLSDPHYIIPRLRCMKPLDIVLRQ